MCESSRCRLFLCVLAAVLALVMFGCGENEPEQSPAEATAVIDGPDGRSTATVASEPSAGSPSKRVAVLRDHVEDALARAYEAHNPTEVDFDTLARVQNVAFDEISLAGSEGVGCSYSMSTLSDHIFVYLACEDDTQEFEWRPAS